MILQVMVLAAAQQVALGDGFYECRSSYTVTHPLTEEREPISFDFQIQAGEVVAANISQLTHGFEFAEVSVAPSADDPTSVVLSADIDDDWSSVLDIELKPSDDQISVDWIFAQPTQSAGQLWIQSMGEGTCNWSHAPGASGGRS